MSIAQPVRPRPALPAHLLNRPGNATVLDFNAVKAAARAEAANPEQFIAHLAGAEAEAAAPAQAPGKRKGRTKATAHDTSEASPEMRFTDEHIKNAWLRVGGPEDLVFYRYNRVHWAVVPDEVMIDLAKMW